METPLRIWVTGANGQLGSELRELVQQYPDYDFTFFSRKELPVEDTAEIQSVFERSTPGIIINCAAYTAVDKAETEIEQAYAINAEAPGILATLAEKSGAKLIHISTDYVFDGEAEIPYTEEDPTNPQSIYGASKKQGETLVLKNNPAAIIIRTSWLYSEFGKNFVKTILKLLNEKVEISVVNDQHGSPTYAADLAQAIMQIISSGKWLPGVFHYCNEGIISWFDFAIALKQLTGSTCKIHPIPTSGYPTPAKRPKYSALDTMKIRLEYEITIKNWKDSLQQCISRNDINEGIN